MRTRYIGWLILPGVIITTLMATNHHVDHLYHVERVQPFILMGFAKIMLIAVLAIQHPGPPPGVSRWRVWRWVDPLSALLALMLMGSAIYFLMLWGGNGLRFRASPAGYNVARWLLWVDGYALMVVSCELIYRGVRARLHNRRRRQEQYDITHESV